ncbi:hypothetical protein BDN72DRAFT_839135, partial [Pluteus cervinus]
MSSRCVLAAMFKAASDGSFPVVIVPPWSLGLGASWERSWACSAFDFEEPPSLIPPFSWTVITHNHSYRDEETQDIFLVTFFDILPLPLYIIPSTIYSSNLDSVHFLGDGISADT